MIALTSLISGHAQGGDKVYGCAKQNNGQLRLVSGPGQCGPSENQVSWGSGGASAGGHLQKTTVVMNYGETRVLTLPESDRPTMVNVCSSPVGGDDGSTVSTPRSGCAGGLFYRDSADGRTVATSENQANLGNFGAGGMMIAPDEDGRLVLSNFECNGCGIGPNPVTYHVDMWF